ncbi:hypothetical protein LCGC14_2068790 [marine sediment metagenome]|uniref:Uncharacterized protein n=1 Tax=marine sediment metagenome TaxID=412755 RepID=A0A0F9EIW8_9ZZZZ
MEGFFTKEEANFSNSCTFFPPRLDADVSEPLSKIDFTALISSFPRIGRLIGIFIRWFACIYSNKPHLELQSIFISHNLAYAINEYTPPTRRRYRISGVSIHFLFLWLYYDVNFGIWRICNVC